MKEYTDYMDSISVDTELHKKIMERVTQGSAHKSRSVIRYSAAAACAAVVLLCVVIVGLLTGDLDGQPENAVPGPEAAYDNDMFGSAGRGLSVFPLTFNTPDDIMSMSATADRIAGFSYGLTDEQISAVFPGLEMLSLTASAIYLHDGSLLEVSAHETDRWTQIRLAEGQLVHTVLIMYEDPPRISDVYGTAVTAFMNGTGDFTYFQADFMLGNIAYHISLTDEMYSGQARMTEIVNSIISLMTRSYRSCAMML
jgi:hypothetical protein